MHLEVLRTSAMAKSSCMWHRLMIRAVVLVCSASIVFAPSAVALSVAAAPSHASAAPVVIFTHAWATSAGHTLPPPAWLVVPALLDFQPVLLHIDVRRDVSSQLRHFCHAHGLAVRVCASVMRRALDSIADLDRVCRNCERRALGSNAQPSFMHIKHLLLPRTDSNNEKAHVTFDWIHDDAKNIATALCAVAYPVKQARDSDAGCVAAVSTAVQRSFDWLHALNSCEHGAQAADGGSKRDAEAPARRRIPVAAVERMVAALTTSPSSDASTCSADEVPTAQEMYANSTSGSATAWTTNEKSIDANHDLERPHMLESTAISYDATAISYDATAISYDATAAAAHAVDNTATCLLVDRLLEHDDSSTSARNERDIDTAAASPSGSDPQSITQHDSFLNDRFVAPASVAAASRDDFAFVTVAHGVCSVEEAPSFGPAAIAIDVRDNDGGYFDHDAELTDEVSEHVAEPESLLEIARVLAALAMLLCAGYAIDMFAHAMRSLVRLSTLRECGRRVVRMPRTLCSIVASLVSPLASSLESSVAIVRRDSAAVRPSLPITNEDDDKRIERHAPCDNVDSSMQPTQATQTIDTTQPTQSQSERPPTLSDWHSRQLLHRSMSDVHKRHDVMLERRDSALERHASTPVLLPPPLLSPSTDFVQHVSSPVSESSSSQALDTEIMRRASVSSASTSASSAPTTSFTCAAMALVFARHGAYVHAAPTRSLPPHSPLVQFGAGASESTVEPTRGLAQLEAHCAARTIQHAWRQRRARANVRASPSASAQSAATTPLVALLASKRTRKRSPSSPTSSTATTHASDAVQLVRPTFLGLMTPAASVNLPPCS